MNTYIITLVIILIGAPCMAIGYFVAYISEKLIDWANNRKALPKLYDAEQEADRKRKAILKRVASRKTIKSYK